MKPIVKKLLSLLLCMVMLAAVLPVNAAFADTRDGLGASQPEEPAAAENEMPQPELPEIDEPEPEIPAGTVSEEQEEPEEPEQEEPEEAEPEQEEPEPADPDEGLTDDELAAKYGIPANWSRSALLFAVRNKILCGKEDGAVHGEDKATRAELAAILSRLFPTAARADLSAFSDMPESWFYDSISQTAAEGFISGSDGKMLPLSVLTREQAFCMIGRAFGYTDGKYSDLLGFSDWQYAGTWSYPQLGAMAQRGIVKGSGDALSPQSTISRAELAQVLFTLSGTVTKEPCSGSGSCVCSSDTVPDGLELDGDLVLCGDGETLELNNLRIGGRLVLQGAFPVSVSLSGCEIGELVLCRKADVVCDTKLKAVTVLEEGSRFSGNADTIDVYAEAYLNCSAEELTLHKGDLKVLEGSEIGTFTVETSADGYTVLMKGACSHTVIRGEGVTIGGSGSLGETDLYANPENCSIVCTASPVNSFAGTDLSSLKFRRTDSSMPEKTAKTKTLSFAVSGAPQEKCDVVWFVNGTVQKTKFGVTIGTVLSETLTFNCNYDRYRSTSVRIRVYCGDRVTEYEIYILIKCTGAEEAKQIRSMKVRAYIAQDTPLYTYSSGYSYSRYLAAGTEVYYDRYASDFRAHVYTDSFEGWVGYYNIGYFSDDHVTWDYSKEAKEYFVNNIYDFGASFGHCEFTSNTDYLIWTNLLTQRVNIFKGYKGHWELIRCARCATGSQRTPTPPMISYINRFSPRWDYTSYNFYVDHVSVFDFNGRAFHSILYTMGTADHICDNTLGRPISHGCIRMLREEATYIYENIPKNTAVVVW